MYLDMPSQSQVHFSLNLYVYLLTKGKAGTLVRGIHGGGNGSWPSFILPKSIQSELSYYLKIV